MQKIIILKGLPGSGKTTWARQEMAAHPNTYKRINKDSLRVMLDSISLVDSGYTIEREVFVLDARDALIGLALDRGFSVIVDDTNFREDHDQRIRDLFGGSALISVRDFTNVPLEECIARDAAREKSIGEEVIRGMWEQYVAPRMETRNCLQSTCLTCNDPHCRCDCHETGRGL